MSVATYMYLCLFIIASTPKLVKIFIDKVLITGWILDSDQN